MRILTLAAIVSLASTSAFAVDTRGVDNGTSLGDVAKNFIASEGGRAQGTHASDPSGDGVKNPDDRVGLANATGVRGDLSETIDLIDGD